MREIKFRGKRIDNGEWAYGSLYIEANNTYILPKVDQTRYCIEYIAVATASVGEFTGVLDFKKNEICEGDSIRVPEHYEGDLLMPEVYCEVVFEDGMFVAKGDGLYDWYSVDETTIDNYEIEIAGSIHESPNIISK